MMAIASKLSAIGILVFSLATGFLTFYLFSDLTMEQKKKHIEELFSQIITFIIFIWLGKVTLNFSIFISDPIAILAYSSDSKSFYFAVVLHAIYLAYKSKVKNFSILPLLDPFLNIFLIASFVYEFIQYEIKDNPYAFGYLILLAILIGIYFFLRERFFGHDIVNCHCNSMVDWNGDLSGYSAVCYSLWIFNGTVVRYYHFCYEY